LVDEMKLTEHPRYQHHNGRPVVSVWGIGLNESNHPPEDPRVAREFIDWFQSGAEERYRATYMGGTPSRWRTLNGDSRSDAAWSDVYTAMDVVQPWNVGRYASIAGADNWKNTVLAPDLVKTAERKQVYMPVIFPGFSWHNLQQQKSPQNQIPRLRG